MKTGIGVLKITVLSYHSCRQNKTLTFKVVSNMDGIRVKVLNEICDKYDGAEGLINEIIEKI